MAVVMPTTLPSELRRDPPLLPGLMAGCLDHVCDCVSACSVLRYGSAQRAHDAGGYRAYESVGVADGDNLFALHGSVDELTIVKGLNSEAGASLT